MMTIHFGPRPMELPAGTRLGPYEIAGHIGSGAMGVVYKARDSRLGRDVAIKVLPPVFARDPDRLSRFEREARAVAAINHPNIVSVHDVGAGEIVDADGKSVAVTYLITELLDGDTLRVRLDQGPLSPRKAADVAMQVARGLSAAHDRSIVHRDLKPENIVLLRDGHVKILDFGLAKQSIAPGSGSDDRTMTSTEAGTVLGTVGYMAPEQVRGEAAGPRSDLFALGAVLFELVTGHRAFQRATAAETMTAILREDPPEAEMTAMPAGLGRIARHALEKDPNDRFQSARDFAFALQAYHDASTSSSGAEPAIDKLPASRKMRTRELAAWALAGVLAAVVAATVVWPRAVVPGSGARVLMTPALPWRDPSLMSPAISPDGTRIAFMARSSSGWSIATRALNAIQTQPLNGTDGARLGGFFWSPAGDALGFFAGGRLKTIDVGTGKIVDLADAPSGYGGSWGLDDTILFAPGERSPIMRVSAKGGEATPVTSLDAAANEEAHRWPQFLPDGRHFIFMPWNLSTTTRKIQLASLDGGARKMIFESESAAIIAGGHYLFIRDQPAHLNALAFDARTFEPEGRPVSVTEDDNVDFFWASGAPLMSASADVLIYTTAKFRKSQLTWMSRTGQPITTVGEPDVYYDPAISRDGATLAVEKRDPDNGTTDLWTVDLARGTFSRLTSTMGFEDVATWSPDGRRIAYSADVVTGPPSLLVRDSSGAGTDELLISGRMIPTDWSRDGRFLLYMTDGGQSRWDVWVYDFNKKAKTALLASGFNESAAAFSPDGKWIAYVSDEARDKQVYVRSFPDGGIRIRVSTAGGEVPEWRNDGKELFFIDPNSTLMAAAVRPAGSSLSIDAPRPLFVTHTEPSCCYRNPLTASLDGQRFLVMSPVVPPETSPLVGVLNWTAGLSRKR